MHCSSNSGKASALELNTAEIINIMEQLSELKICDIAFSGGEPFLRKDIFDILFYAKSKDFQIGISTNGIVLNKDVVRRLKGLVSRIQISIDGLEITHDFIRRKKGLFKKVMEAFELCIGEGLYTRACFTPNRINYTEMDKLIDLMAGLGVHLFNVSQFIRVGRGPRDLELSSNQLYELLKIWDSKRKEYEGRMSFSTHTSQLALIEELDTHDEGFIGCQAGIGVSCITPDGYLTPCVLLPEKIGNLREESFKTIWENSEIIRRLKDRNLLEGKCVRCMYKYKCGGCRAAAFSRYNNYLADDPYCWLS